MTQRLKCLKEEEILTSNLIFCNHDVYLKKKQGLNEVPKKSNRIVEIQQTHQYTRVRIFE